MRAPWLISRTTGCRTQRQVHVCAMTHLFVCHDSIVCVTWLIHMCATRPLAYSHDWLRNPMTSSWIYMNKWGHMCDINHFSHDWLRTPMISIFIHVYHINKWGHACAMTHFLHDWLWNPKIRSCVPWLIRRCAMTHSYVCHTTLVSYGVATISRLLKRLGHFCRI